MPANSDVLAINFHFDVKADAGDVTTRLRFIDGGQVSGQPVINSITAGPSYLNVTPEVAESFLLIDCLLHILPDGAVFIRGDSNQDGKVDVSDAVNTLGHLFLGAGPLSCADAADANDDGSLDISDPVATLDFLFLGGSSLLPAPAGEKGVDPTPDGLACFTIP
jgi:hypothetical protein